MAQTVFTRMRNWLKAPSMFLLLSMTLALGSVSATAQATAPPNCTDRGFSDYETLVLDVYLAYYGRPADIAGMEYWAMRLMRESGSLDAIIDAFANSEESQNRFGALTNAELIAYIYQSLFGRDPEAQGAAFYLAGLTSGAMTPQSIALDVLNGALNADRTIIDQRVEAARYFVNALECTGRAYGADDIDDARAFLQQVFVELSSLSAAKLAIDAFVGIDTPHEPTPDPVPPVVPPVTPPVTPPGPGGSNPTPLADAGPDRSGKIARSTVSPGIDEIVFVGSGGSRGTEFAWSVVSAPGSDWGQLAPTSPQSGLYGAAPGDYLLQLSVGNGEGVYATDTVTVTLRQDADGDGLTDAMDPDRDGDGFANVNDTAPDDIVSHRDEDGDGVGNYYTPDVDGDGRNDEDDAFPLDPQRQDAIIVTEMREGSGVWNRNDGTGIAEDVGALPLAIEGAVTSSSTSRPDLDYFRFTATAGSYSVVLTAPNLSRPDVTIIDANARPITSLTTELGGALGLVTYATELPADGTYYLVVTDLSGTSDPSWSYAVRAYADGDRDGAPDDFEQAIDASEIAVDGDGDGISDFVEIQDATRTGWPGDFDGDGRPPWWDLDSDGDLIPDDIEYLTAAEMPGLSVAELAERNDADGDGVPNYLDTDSDDNGDSDHSEVGANPLSPTDLDQDGRADYLDLDNDGDGIADSDEPAGGVNQALAFGADLGLPTAQTIRLLSVHNQTLDAEAVCRPGDALLVTGAGLPTDPAATHAIFNTLDGAVNLIPDAIDADGIHLTCPLGVDPGLAEFYLATADQRSGSLPLLFAALGSPVLTRFSFDPVSGIGTIEGVDLAVQLEVYLTGASVSVDHRGGDPARVEFAVPVDARSGALFVNSAAGDSNTINAVVTQLINGTIDSPSTGLDPTQLDVSLGLLDDVAPAADGSFITEVPANTDAVVTALTALPGSTAANPAYITHLSGVWLPGDTQIRLDATSTAIAMVWQGVGVSQLLPAAEWAAFRDQIAGLNEVQALGTVLASSLRANPAALYSPGTALDAAMEAALIAGADLLTPAQVAAALARLATTQRVARGLFGDDATVEPAEVDDISVYENGDSGNVTVENDTQLYLSAKIATTAGAVLQPHITGFSGMSGPQGLGLLFWASSTDYSHPGGRNALVEIVTPGVDRDYDPKVDAPSAVWRWLFMRTLVERVVWPPIGDYLGAIDADDFVKILFAYAPNLVDVVVNQALAGDVSGALGTLVTTFFQDLVTAPTGGPITQALVTKFGAGIAEELLKKVAAKLGAKLIPVVGQIATVAEVIGKVSGTTQAGVAVADLLTTDAVIQYKVTFPVSITAVVPDLVKPDGTDRLFKIEGTGFTPIGRGIWPFNSTLQPRVRFEDADGLLRTLDPISIAADGTSMEVVVNGWWLNENTNGPLSVEVHHPVDEPNAKVSLDDAVEIVDETVITSIAPVEGNAGITATIYGAGFSPSMVDNQVAFGGSLALVVSATDTQLRVVVPSHLDPGTYAVDARARFDGVWGDWSNTVDFEVIENTVAITVCDNGGAKDDAFALYVDGAYEGTMYASWSSYCDTYDLGLSAGSHSARLLGVEAPDNIGTYSISFTGVTGLTGSPTSGSDLVPGVSKFYSFDVAAPAPMPQPLSARAISPSVQKGDADEVGLRTAPYQPSRYDPEAPR